MKRIYSKDIKAMKLTEDEMYWAKDVFDEINKRGVNSISLKYYLRTDRYDIEDKTSMLKKALKYFAKKYLKEIGGIRPMFILEDELLCSRYTLCFCM